MVLLSAFADEISPDLDTQLEVLSSEGIKHIEFRGVWNKNVLQLTNDELAVVKQRLDTEGFGVSSIGSPIGKISVADDFEPHFADFERAIHVAKRMGARYIRIFSFYTPGEKAPEQYRDEVLRRMSLMVKRAEEEGIILVHENEKHIYGENHTRCLDLLDSCHSPSLRMAFDPANFVQSNVRPMADAYPVLERFVEYVHIKDACFEDGRVTPAGEGDGDLDALIKALKRRDYGGFLSIEPHLKWSKDHSQLSGPEAFRIASKALKALLESNTVPWQ